MHYEQSWTGGPRHREGAFSGAYRCYRIDGLPRMDSDTFFTRVRWALVELLMRESRTGAVCSQATT